MIGSVRGFLRCDNGAVTVDWVVLTAVAAAFGVIVVSGLNTGVTSVANEIGVVLGSVAVADEQMPGAAH